MSSKIECTFKIDSWNEEPISVSEEGPKLTRAIVKQTYIGPLDAESTIEYLMTTFEDGTSQFIGIEEVLGELNGQSGSFLIKHNGTHENGVAKSTFRVVPNSGSGDLSGITGNGHYEATHDEANLFLNYSFAEQ